MEEEYDKISKISRFLLYFFNALSQDVSDFVFIPRDKKDFQLFFSS